jgi:hypothetical protein
MQQINSFGVTKSCAADTLGEFGETVRYLTHEVQAHHCDIHFYPENYNNSKIWNWQKT